MLENNIKHKGIKNMNETLIGACGIFCRACDHYFANTKEGAHLAHKSKIRKRVLAHPCMGCRAENENEICVYCVSCEVRLCSLEQNVRLCTECSQYPCDRLKKFHTGLAHKREAVQALEENKGCTLKQWYALAEKRWTCPFCGHKYSYYEKSCVQCSASLNGLEPDLR